MAHLALDDGFIAHQPVDGGALEGKLIADLHRLDGVLGFIVAGGSHVGEPHLTVGVGVGDVDLNIRPAHGAGDCLDIGLHVVAVRALHLIPGALGVVHGVILQDLSSGGPQVVYGQLVGNQRVRIVVILHRDIQICIGHGALQRNGILHKVIQILVAGGVFNVVVLPGLVVIDPVHVLGPGIVRREFPMHIDALRRGIGDGLGHVLPIDIPGYHADIGP